MKSSTEHKMLNGLLAGFGLAASERGSYTYMSEVSLQTPGSLFGSRSFGAVQPVNQQAVRGGASGKDRPHV